MPTTCPNPSYQANQIIARNNGKDAVDVVHAFLENSKFSLDQFDPKTGRLIAPDGSNIAIGKLVDKALVGDFINSIEGDLNEALDLMSNGDLADPLIEKGIGGTFSLEDGILYLDGEEVLREDEVDNRKEVELLVERAAFEKAVREELNKEDDLYKRLKNLHKLIKNNLDSTPEDFNGFINKLFSNSVYRNKVYRLNEGRFWKKIRTRIIQNLGVPSNQRVNEVLLGELAPGTNYVNRSRDKREKEKLYDQIKRTFKNRIREFQNRGEEELAKEEEKRERKVLRAMERAVDSETLRRVTTGNLSSLKALLDEHAHRKANGGVDLNWLGRFVGQARSYKRELEMLDDMLRGEGILEGAENRRKEVKEALSLIRDAENIFRDETVPMVAEALAPHDLEVEMEYREEFKKEFGSYGWGRSFFSDKVAENRRKYKSRAEFEEARRKFVERNIEEKRDEIERETRERLEKELEETEMADIGYIRSMLFSPQQSGRPLIGLTKVVMDHAKDRARRKTIEKRQELFEKYQAFYEKRVEELGREPKTLKELYDPILEQDDKGNYLGTLVGEINQAQFRENLKDLHEEIADETDPLVRKEKTQEWFVNNMEQPYVDEWYNRIDAITPERTEKQKRLEREKADILRMYKQDDGLGYDYDAIDEVDLAKLRSLQERIEEARTKMNQDQWDEFTSLVDFEETEQFREVKEKMRERLSDEEFNEWLDSQKFTTANGTRDLLRHWTTIAPTEDKWVNDNYDEPGTPRKEIYSSSKYEEIQERNDEISEFYNSLVQTREELDKSRPPSKRLGLQLPSIRKTEREKKMEDGSVEAIKEFGRDAMRIQIDDIEYGAKVAAESVEGNVGEHIPIFYTHTPSTEPSTDSEVAVDDVSFDIMRSFTMDAHNSYLFEARSEIRGLIENTKRLKAEQDIDIKTPSGLDMIGLGIGNAPKDKGKNTNAYDMLINSIEKNLYGIEKLDDSLLGMDSSTWDSLLRFNSVQLLSMNTKSMGANTLTGNVMLHIEGAVGELVNGRSLRRAQKYYFSEIHDILGDVGSDHYESRTNILGEYFDSLNDFSSSHFSHSYGSPDSNLSNRTKRFIGQGDALYMTTSMPEHYVQNLLMYAVLDDTPIMNNQGEYIDSDGNVVETKKEAMTLLEASDTSGGTVTFNENAKKMSLNGRTIPVNDESMSMVTAHIRGVNTQLHGAYSSQNQGEIQRHTMGRVLMQMHGWLIPQFEKRWGGVNEALKSGLKGQERKLRFDYQNHYHREGSYSTAVWFLSSLMRDTWSRQLDIKARIGNLTDQEAANIKRVGYELFTVGATMYLFQLMSQLGSDAPDESGKKQMLYYLAYVVRRTQAEVGQYTPVIGISEFMSLTEDPAAILGMVERGNNLVRATTNAAWGITVGDGIPTYERGFREGQYKIRKDAEELLPWVPHAMDWFHMEDATAYYNQ